MRAHERLGARSGARKKSAAPARQPCGWMQRTFPLRGGILPCGCGRMGGSARVQARERNWPHPRVSLAGGCNAPFPLRGGIVPCDVGACAAWRAFRRAEEIRRARASALRGGCNAPFPLRGGGFCPVMRAHGRLGACVQARRFIGPAHSGAPANRVRARQTRGRNQLYPRVSPAKKNTLADESALPVNPPRKWNQPRPARQRRSRLSR